MQSEHQNAPSRNLRFAAENRTSRRANQTAKSDSRRFAAIFPLEVDPVHCGDATPEEQDDSDDSSQLEPIVALDEDTSTIQPVESAAASAVECSSLSAAQRIVACYRGSNDSSSDATTGSSEKELPEDIEDQCSMDQRSTYTLAVSVDAQSTMDMTWKPKLKIHMRRNDQRALMQAQSQAITMMHNAGLKPTNKIQCRRLGCPDILPNVEALKYHIHIHNIADSTARYRDVSPFPRKRSPLECSTPSSTTSKRNHTRSKSSPGICSTAYPLPRTHSASSLPPLPDSSRESTPDVPSPATILRDFPPDPTSSDQAILLPVDTDETYLVHIRGRKMEGMDISDAECRPVIPPSPSPPIMHSPIVLTPPAKLPVAHSSGAAADSESATESAHSASGELTESRIPVRAFSPTWAMSPIRIGIRRILTIGSPDGVADK